MDHITSSLLPELIFALLVIAGESAILMLCLIQWVLSATEFNRARARKLNEPSTPCGCHGDPQ